MPELSFLHVSSETFCVLHLLCILHLQQQIVGFFKTEQFIQVFHNFKFILNIISYIRKIVNNQFFCCTHTLISLFSDFNYYIITKLVQIINFAPLHNIISHCYIFYNYQRIYAALTMFSINTYFALILLHGASTMCNQ